jgi:hypothetical protein
MRAKRGCFSKKYLHYRRRVHAIESREYAGNVQVGSLFLT